MTEATERVDLDQEVALLDDTHAEHGAVGIDSIAPHPRNSNTGNVEEIKKSLERFGQARTIVVSNEGTIIAGNHTWAAAKELGWDKIDVTKVPLGYQDALAYLEADNRLAELGKRDPAKLAENLTELEAANKLAGTGYSPDDVEDVIAEAGKVPDMPEGEDKAEFAASEEEVAAGWNRPEGGAPPEQPMKELPFLFTPEAAEQFVKVVGALKRRWGMGKASDVVLEAVKRCEAQQEDAEPEASE